MGGYIRKHTFSLISDPGKWELQHASENIWFSSMSDASKWEHASETTHMFVDRLPQQMGAQTNAEVTL